MVGVSRSTIAVDMKLASRQEHGRDLTGGRPGSGVGEPAEAGLVPAVGDLLGDQHGTRKAQGLLRTRSGLEPCRRARCARTAPRWSRSRPASEERAPADPASSGPSATRRESRGTARWRYDGHLVGSTAPPHLVVEAHRKGAIGVLLVIRHHHTAPTAGAKCVDDVSAGIGQRAPPRAHRTPSRPGSGSSKSSARTSAQRPWRRHTARDSDGSSVGRISRS